MLPATQVIPPANYDEALIEPYTLPSALISCAGEMIDSIEKWETVRRPELLELFATHLYGAMPTALPFEATVVEESREALGGKAIRRQVEIRFHNPHSSKTSDQHGPTLQLALYLPNHAAHPAPCFLGLNFSGNHAAFTDPAIHLAQSWIGQDAPGVVDNRATEASRGTRPQRWPVEMIIDRGYALATAYYGDIDPDFDDGFQNGVHPLFPTSHERPGNNPATITAWAWGLSRLLDVLTTQPEIDATRVAVTGHSRLGKAALWAGACDPRFALVISNNSGCGGAALSRRNFGETMDVIIKKFPHWFCDNGMASASAADIAASPIDQHLLVSLLAPRPVFISSAEDDRWADPKGEFLGGYHASDVYRLFGCDGLAADEMPPLNIPIHSRIGYSIRPGAHDITPEDWAVHLDFADKHLERF